MEQQPEILEAQMRERLAQLTEELEKGQEMFRAVESQQRQLGETLLRISGARQVLLELLGEEGGDTAASTGSDDSRSGDAVVPAPVALGGTPPSGSEAVEAGEAGADEAVRSLQRPA